MAKFEVFAVEQGIVGYSRGNPRLIGPDNKQWSTKQFNDYLKAHEAEIKLVSASGSVVIIHYKE